MRVSGSVSDATLCSCANRDKCAISVWLDGIEVRQRQDGMVACSRITSDGQIS